MHFINNLVDDAIIAEMRDEQVLGPVEMDLMDARIGSAEAIHLNDALMLVANDIKPGPWLQWLIHIHDCLRLCSIVPDAAMILAAGFSRDQARIFTATGNYPAMRSEKGWLVGITRPDQIDQTSLALEGISWHRLAITLSEAKDLRGIYRQVAGQLA